MDDLTAKLSELLNDPQALENLKSVAGMLLDSDSSESSGPRQRPPRETRDEREAAQAGDSAGELEQVIKVFSALKSAENDERARLLLALKPHLSEERRARVDRAVRLLKLAGILPLLQETDLLKLLD